MESIFFLPKLIITNTPVIYNKKEKSKMMKGGDEKMIRYEDDELFYRIISGVFPMDIHILIREGYNLELYYDYDYFEDVGYIIVSNDEEILLKMRSPKLSYCSGSGPIIAQKAASNQKQIDVWLKLFAENLEYIANTYALKELKVKVKYIMAYKERMYWISRDMNENCVYIHPYVKENYPAQYEEIRRLNGSEGYTVIVNNFERKQCDQFKKWGIDYLKIKEED